LNRCLEGVASQKEIYVNRNVALRAIVKI